jgi:transcriptional regulator with XRE-family HTH domain
MAESASTLARRRVATNVRRIRAGLGWSQERSCEAIGCSVQALRRIEGAKAVVTLDLLADIAKGYRVDLSELFVAPIGPWQKPRAGRPRTKPQAPVRRSRTRS